MVETMIENLEVWTTAQNPKTNGRGRGASNQSLHGINKLRELILELAVRGKLLPQDPDDEPASELLKKIAKEKAWLAKEGEIKKLKALPEITEDEKPFELPIGWEWERIGNIGHDWGQKTPDNDFSYIEVSAIDNLKGIVRTATRLSATEAPSRARKLVRVGTVLYSTVRPYLKNICVIDREYSPEAIASTAFAILHPFQQMPGKFIIAYLRSPVFVKYVELVQTGIAYPAINDKQFFGGIIPIPPLAEQHRIVAKVDELMALCDQLEQQQTESNASHQTLVETLFGTLTNVESQKDFNEAWLRIANHFDVLFTTEQSIDQLKQIILQLAVMGKLVPQDPHDEPASELLKKIAKEKDKLVKEGKIKKQKPLPEVEEDEKPFEIPENWKWVKWDSIALKIGDIDHKMPEQVKNGYPYVSPRDFIAGNGIDLEGAKKISQEDFLRLASKIQPQRGDIIYPRYGTIGENRLVKTDKDFLASYSCCVIKTLHGFVEPTYQFIFSLSSLVKEQAKFAENKTTQANVGIKSIQNYNVPLPPLVEQHRIVSKVDELFTICDALKERITETQETKIKLADALIEKAIV